MYKVLLADDEVLIREAIRENIKWAELGYELIDVCENGKRAIESINQEKPDLIISDICMPYVDGLELARYVYENDPSIKVLIISGYDNFEYAKNAIKYNVMEYILKPITANELSKTLWAICEELNEKNQESRKVKRLIKEYEKSKIVLAEKYLNVLLRKSQEQTGIKDRLREYGISMEGEYFCVVQIWCRTSFDFKGFLHLELQDELANFAILNVIREMLQDSRQAIIFQDGDNVGTIIFSGESIYQLEMAVGWRCKKIQSYITDTLAIETTVAIGTNVDSLHELTASYDSIRHVQKYEFSIGCNPMVFGKEFEEIKAEDNLDINLWGNRFITDIKLHHIQDLETDINDFFSCLRASYLSKSKIITSIQGVVIRIMLAIDGREPVNNEMAKKEKQVIEMLLDLANLEKAEKDFGTFVFDIAAILSEKNGGIHNKSMAALDYIDQNYHDPEISLQSVCSYMNMSISNFSLMFKQHTGETFIEALIKKRIQKARELLETTDLRVYEIAAEVGYTDPHYFSSTFKKIVGQTPKEYNKKRREER